MKTGLTCKGCGRPRDEYMRGCHNCQTRHSARNKVNTRRVVVARVIRHDDIPLPPLRFRALVAEELRLAGERARQCARLRAAS